MQREIRQVTKDGKFTQITIADSERWYLKEIGKNKVDYYASISWIASYCPKPIQFMKWLAEKGWDEAEMIKATAGVRGHKVHQMISTLLIGKSIAITDKAINPQTGELEDITLEEYECLMSFVDWMNETKPKIIANEMFVHNEQYKYAGMVDLICEIDGAKFIVDFKTSQNIWDNHLAQIAGYQNTDELTSTHNLAILQLGYKRNKKKFKFTVIDDRTDLFQAARTFWKNEHGDDKPKVIDYPTELSVGKHIDELPKTDDELSAEDLPF